MGLVSDKPSSDSRPTVSSSFTPVASRNESREMLPELLYMEAKWSSLARTFCRLIAPWTSKPCGMDTLKVAKRLEAELGDEQASCIEGDASAWDLLPLPEGALFVDGLGWSIGRGIRLSQVLLFSQDWPENDAEWHSVSASMCVRQIAINCATCSPATAAI